MLHKGVVMEFDDLHGLGLLTHETDMLAEGLPLSPVRKLDVVGDDGGVLVVGVGGDVVVSLKVCRGLPCLVVSLGEDPTDPYVHVSVEHEPQARRLLGGALGRPLCPLVRDRDTPPGCLRR